MVNSESESSMPDQEILRRLFCCRVLISFLFLDSLSGLGSKPLQGHTGEESFFTQLQGQIYNPRLIEMLIRKS